MHNMPTPETSTQLQKFFSMVTYLSSFVPSLSSFTATLHELLKKDTEFTWNQSYQNAFDTVKCLVYTDTTLGYFDVHKPITINVDASQKGLSATLLQEGYPVAFAPKALTPVENQYANIQYEITGCVFGVEWFHIYILAIHSLLRATRSLMTIPS